MINRLPTRGQVADPATGQTSRHDLDRRDFDRLVDGDLSPSERRQLLAALADEPGGWQRCALAFLEAQSWRKACRQLASDPSSSPPGAESSQSAETSPAALLWRQRDLRRLARGVAAAAAVLALVFCGGLATGRAWPMSLPQVADDQSSSDKTASSDATHGVPQSAVARDNDGKSGNRHEGRVFVHVLGFINLPGEDGARQTVPILAAPGLKVDAPPQQATLAASGVSPGRADTSRVATSTTPSLDGEPAILPLAAGQRVAIPADWVNALAQGQSVY